MNKKILAITIMISTIVIIGVLCVSLKSCSNSEKENPSIEESNNDTNDIYEELKEQDGNDEGENVEDKNVEDKKENSGDDIVSWGDATEGIVDDNRGDNGTSENIATDENTADKDSTDKDTTDKDTTDKDMADKDTTDDNPAGDISVKKYTITYNVNNENATMDTTTQTVTYGEEFVLAKPKIVAGDDYRFVKWVITGTSMEFKSGKYNLNSDISLTAVWEDNYSKNY